MRKNSVRKWLHAVLDFLPLLVITIFAIYTRNENYNSNIEVQVQVNKQVDFNQMFNYYQNNTQYIQTTFANDGLLTFDVNNDTGTSKYNRISTYFNLYQNHKYYFRYLPNTSMSSLAFGTQLYIGSVINGNPSLNVQNNELIFTSNGNQDNATLNIQLQSTNIDTTFSVYLNLFDLTQIFGEGNEPTMYQFNQIFTDVYYPYTPSKQVLIYDYNETYNDTDVGSQFVYTLYNATDKYFNCTNLFNLEQVWNWVQLNLFGGNAPLMVYVVWQVIVYEFFMDLIFLLYSVFMFVIDFATNCIDRFTGRANKC